MTATITDLVMRLVAAGAGPTEAAACIAEAHAIGAASVQSGGSPVDKAAERRRAFDRQRKAEKRKAAKPGGDSPPEVRGSPRKSTGSPVEQSGIAPLSILPSLSASQGIQEEKKEVLNTEPREKRTRGARLPDDWQPSDIDMKFAAGRGLRLVEIEIEATKFRNYWTNRTDKLASKPRWDRAWENWILSIKGNANGQGRPRTVQQAAQDQLDTYRAIVGERAPTLELELQPGVRDGAGAPDVRLLPPR